MLLLSSGSLSPDSRCLQLPPSNLEHLSEEERLDDDSEANPDRRAEETKEMEKAGAKEASGADLEALELKADGASSLTAWTPPCSTNLECSANLFTQLLRLNRIPNQELFDLTLSSPTTQPSLPQMARMMASLPSAGQETRWTISSSGGLTEGIFRTCRVTVSSARIFEEELCKPEEET